jgi:hypothetical protein
VIAILVSQCIDYDTMLRRFCQPSLHGIPFLFGTYAG